MTQKTKHWPEHLITHREFLKLVKDLQNAKVFKQKPFTRTKMVKLSKNQYQYTLYYSENTGNWETTIKIWYKPQDIQISTDLDTYIVIEACGLFCTIHEINNKDVIGTILDTMVQDIHIQITKNCLKIRENMLFKRFLKKYSGKWRKQWKT